MAALSRVIATTRYDRVLPFVRGDVLDVGAQRGQIYALAKSQITGYVGLDMDADAVDRARRDHPGVECRVLNVDEEELDYEEQFDTSSWSQ